MTAAYESSTTSWRWVAASMFAIAWGGNEFTPLLVMYRQSHGLGPVIVDSLLFAYVLGIVPALLLGGPFADRFGRRAVMLPAPIIAMAGSLVLAAGSDSVTLLFLGRVLSGVALGFAMAAGTAWLKELSASEAEGVGARRAAMSLTAGFGLGAAVAGSLAQWAPWHDHLAYLVNVAITIPGAVMAFSVPETVTPRRSQTSLRSDLAIPSVAHRRFLCVVAPAAPWVFGSAATAYAILPGLMTTRVSGWPIAFSALACLVGLGIGFMVQPFGRRIDKPGTARTVAVGIAITVVGYAVAAVAAHLLTIALTLLAAAILGVGYGLTLVGGLLEVQRIAGPRDLAGLTAVFYCLTYLGFATPVLMALVAQQFPSISYPEMLGCGALVALGCLALILANYRSASGAEPVISRTA